MEFSHFKDGKAVMVDVSKKEDTSRKATACGSIEINTETMDLIVNGGVKKGDVLGVARVAAIMASKKTYELIPMCHPLLLTGANIDFEIDQENLVIYATGTVKTTGQTGVEMEALQMVSTALLTIYDMCKAIDKEMIIGRIYLKEKTGGKSGKFVNSKIK
ncbi:MAG: cyclic pyranopterin monophosphate synthase MoaC [Fusobacteriia bacterium 4572_74]|nr:MAG: cyclic pyranopterin monophosphate synthase MoaC [Fusobacteriia bacterium 4572_74]